MDEVTSDMFQGSQQSRGEQGSRSFVWTEFCPLVLLFSSFNLIYFARMYSFVLICLYPVLVFVLFLFVCLFAFHICGWFPILILFLNVELLLLFFQFNVYLLTCLVHTYDLMIVLWCVFRQNGDGRVLQVYEVHNGRLQHSCVGECGCVSVSLLKIIHILF